jgi:hypothetical protein
MERADLLETQIMIGQLNRLNSSHDAFCNFVLHGEASSLALT